MGNQSVDLTQGYINGQQRYALMHICFCQNEYYATVVCTQDASPSQETNKETGVSKMRGKIPLRIGDWLRQKAKSRSAGRYQFVL